MKNRKLIAFLKIISVPVLYAIALRFLFGIKSWNSLFSVMSLTFLICSPFITGVLTVYFSPEKYARRSGYQILMPWIPVLLFFIITLLIKLEGWACWAMILPIFLIFSSFGGLVGAWLKFRKKDNRLNMCLIVVLPFILSPMEKMMGMIPGVYKADTYIDIKAPADNIWHNLTQVKTISKQEDKGRLTHFLEFPRPIKAILNYEGVGAYREAVFTGGLKFYESVLEYIPYKKMVFSIKAYPYQIPSTTMDDHIVVGGQYFDVLIGAYELEQISGTVYRLHLYSYFKLSTNFNFYASWWAKAIMRDIQNNILQVIKNRAESATKQSVFTSPSDKHYHH